MTLYRAEMLRTAAPGLTKADALNIAALGLAGEAGEFVDLIKKHLFHSHPLDRNKAIKELGDVRWYLELAAFAVGVTMEEVEDRNVAKLRERYPNGFSTEASQKRVVWKKYTCGKCRGITDIPAHIPDIAQVVCSICSPKADVQ